MVNQLGNTSAESERNAISASNVTPSVADRLAGLKQKIDALADMPEKGQLYKMAASMSAKVLDMAGELSQDDPDKEEAMAAVFEMVDATFELREQDNIINSSNEEALRYENDVIQA